MNCTDMSFKEIFEIMERYKQNTGEYPEKILFSGKALMDLKPAYEKMMKKKESRAKLPCVCGRKRKEIGYGYKKNIDGKWEDRVLIRCPNCDRKVESNSEIGAIRAWNEMIRNESNT